jgi:hypothetical protein
LTSLLRPPTHARKNADPEVTLGRKVGPNQAVALGPTQAGELSFYPSALRLSFRHLNDTLVRWAIRKYKRLRRHRARARRLIADVSQRQPNLFAHWRFGVRPDGWTMGAR